MITRPCVICGWQASAFVWGYGFVCPAHRKAVRNDPKYVVRVDPARHK